MSFMESNFLEAKDCVFIKGLPTNADIDVSHVRQYFEERVGECCVEMTSLSRDKRWFYVALKFKSPSVAENVIERFDGKYIFGHRVMMSYWRIPRKERLWQESHQQNENFDCNRDMDVRCGEDTMRERHLWNTEHAPSNPDNYKERDDFREDGDNMRHYQDKEGQYKTSDNYSYEEQAEEYFSQQWDTDEVENAYYEDSWNDWDSDYNGSRDNFSEREEYQREEDNFPYHHKEDAWQGCEAGQGNNQVFINQTQSWDHNYRYREPDKNHEFYCDHHDDSFNEEHIKNYYDISRKRSEETSYETEDLRERIREWRGQRDNSRTQDLQAERQEDISNNFSRFDENDHHSRWEVTPHSDPTRRRFSDPDDLQEWEQDYADRRSRNNSRDWIGRKRGNFSEERSRSDEWSESGWKHEKRGRQSTSPVSLRSRDHNHQVIPLSDEVHKGSREAFDSSGYVDRLHGGDLVQSVRGHHTSLTSKGKRSSPIGSTRGSSSEGSSDCRRHESSPRSERSCYSLSEQSSERRRGCSRNFSSRERHHNSRVQNERGHPERTRKEGDLRRSLIEHQHRKHFSSIVRERTKEEDTNCSAKERISSPDEHNRSTSSRNSTESSSLTKTGNKKRHLEPEKTRHDMESAKKKKETIHSSSRHSDAERKRGESRGNKPSRSPGERRTHSSRDRVSRTVQKPRDKVSDKSSTRRTDRFLNDLAVTLVEDNISLRRPSPSLEAKQRNSESKRDPAKKCRNHRSPTKRSYTKCPEQDNAMHQTIRDEDPQLENSSGEILFASERVVEWYTTEESSEEGTATSDCGTTWLTGRFFVGNSDQDVDSVTEACDSAKVFQGDSFHVDEFVKQPEIVVNRTKVLEKVGNNRFEQVNPSLADYPDFKFIETNDTFIFDDFKRTHKVEANKDVLSLKTSGIRLVRQENGNLRVENCHVVDMDFSSDDQTSPDVIKTGNTFCYKVDAISVEKEHANDDKEEKGINRKSSPDNKRPKKITTNLADVSLSGSVSSLYEKVPSVSSPEVKHVAERCIFQQERYNTEPRAANNSRRNAAGLRLLYTEPSIDSGEVNQDEGSALTQTTCNTEDCNRGGKRKQVDTAADDKKVNTSYTEVESCNSCDVADRSKKMKHSLHVDKPVKEAASTERLGSKREDFGNKERVTDRVFQELTQGNDPKSERKTILKIDNEVHAKSAHRTIGHDSDDHDDNAMIEEYSVEHGNEKNNGQETTPDEVTDDVVNGARVRHMSQEVESKKEKDCSAGWRSWKSTEAEAAYRDQEHLNERSSDPMSNENATNDACNTRTNALNLREVNNRIQQRSEGKIVDFDQTVEKQKCDDRALEIPAIGDFFVTHQEVQTKDSNASDIDSEMHSSQKFTPCANGSRKDEDHVTQQKMTKADVVSSVSITSRKVPSTDCPSLDTSLPEQGDRSNVSQADPDIINRSCFNWSQMESYQSNLDDADKTATSSLNRINSNHGRQERKVTENLEHVDMEISSEEEHRLHLVDSVARSVDGTSGKPYSPSSPTVKSDEQCSPRPKDSSPYSPSHPTNISEGDVEQNDLVKELSYHEEDETHGVSTCEDAKIIAGAFKNSFQGNDDRQINAQVINDDSSVLSTVTSDRVFSVSTSESLLSVLTVKDALEMNMPADHMAPSRADDKKTSSEYGKHDDNGIAAFSCSSSLKNINQKSQKSSLGYPGRTQSLPDISPVAVKPKIVYINSTRKKEVNAQGKLPSRNDKSVVKAMNSGIVNCMDVSSVSTDEINPLVSAPSKPSSVPDMCLDLHEKSLSQATCHITEVPFKNSLCMSKSGEGTEFDTNCGSVGTSVVTYEMIDRRPITSTSEITADKRETCRSHEHEKRIVSEGEICDREGNIDEKSITRVPEQRVVTLQTHNTSNSKPDNKRPCDDPRKGPRPCKVPKKSLKLVIPSHQVSGGAKSTVRKRNSSTVSCADEHCVPDVSDKPINKRDPGGKADGVTDNPKISFDSKEIAKNRAKSLRKTISHTDTRADVVSVPQPKSLPEDEMNNCANENMLTVNTSDTANSDPASAFSILGGGNTETESSSLSPSDSCQAAKEHTSPSLTNRSSHDQHSSHPLSSTENLCTKKYGKKGTGLENDAAVFKMERLRKKKEEIEQVYKRECQTVINVVKMLVSNDPRLEGVLQNAVRRSLQEMGQRCVQELEKEIRPAM